MRHIVALFPNAKLRSLTAPMIHAAYDEARASGRFGKEIYQINKRLRQILDAAVEDGLIKKNPARKVSVARPDPEPKDYLDPPRLAAFNAAVLAMPWCGEKIATLILLHTGIRPGEVYAFSWADFSFARCRLDVSRQYSNDMELRRPKSRASIDWVAVDSALWSHLAEWKLAQRDLLARVGVEQHQDTPIVTNSLGGRFDPTNFGRWFRNFCADNGDMATHFWTGLREDQARLPEPCRRHVAERRVQPAVVVPVHPVEELRPQPVLRRERPPAHQLALEHPVRRLDDRVVVGVAGARDRPLDSEGREQRVDIPVAELRPPDALLSVKSNSRACAASLWRSTSRARCIASGSVLPPSWCAPRPSFSPRSPWPARRSSAFLWP